jgi:hypothetical protein
MEAWVREAAEYLKGNLEVLNEYNKGNEVYSLLDRAAHEGWLEGWQTETVEVYAPVDEYNTIYDGGLAHDEEENY